jgi:hypothetical protein
MAARKGQLEARSLNTRHGVRSLEDSLYAFARSSLHLRPAKRCFTVGTRFTDPLSTSNLTRARTDPGSRKSRPRPGALPSCKQYVYASSSVLLLASQDVSEKNPLLEFEHQERSAIAPSLFAIFSSAHKIRRHVS